MSENSSGEARLTADEAHDGANLMRIIAEENNNEKGVTTAEDYEEAFQNLKELIDGAESDKNALGTIGKFSGALLVILGSFPYIAVGPLLEAYSNADKEKAKTLNREYVPLKEGLKLAFDKVGEEFKANYDYATSSRFEKELERLKQKAQLLDD